MADPTILRLAREAFRRRCEEVGEEQARRELEASFDRTLDKLTDATAARTPVPPTAD
jgi:hypothetical protein